VFEGLLLVLWSSIGLWVVGWVGLWVQSFYFAMGWVGLGKSFGRLGWVELNKLDPRITLVCQYKSCLFWTRRSMVPMVADQKIRRVKFKVDEMMSSINEKVRRVIYMKRLCRSVCRSIHAGDDVVQYRTWSEGA